MQAVDEVIKEVNVDERGELTETLENWPEEPGSGVPAQHTEINVKDVFHRGRVLENMKLPIRGECDEISSQFAALPLCSVGLLSL